MAVVSVIERIVTALFSPFYKLREHAIVVAIFATTICALVVALYAGPAVVLVADAHATSLVLGAATGPHGSAQELCSAAAAHGSCNITMGTVLQSTLRLTVAGESCPVVPSAPACDAGAERVPVCPRAGLALHAAGYTDMASPMTREQAVAA